MEQLQQILNKYAINLTNTNTLIEQFFYNHINNALLLGLITKETSLLNRSEATANLHHEIIKKVNQEIWKPSRTITQVQTNRQIQISVNSLKDNSINEKHISIF
ncbi:20259_t:CDS:1, partial [Dentiscutata erythropus]